MAAPVAQRKILLCQPRGFCAGVERAIDIIDGLVRTSKETIYVRKEVVHNRYVIEAFKKRGVVFVDNADEAPVGALVVFSAHGVSLDVRRRAEIRAQRTIDATCPLVTKVHREVHRFAEEGLTVFLVGHAGHEEVDGILGQRPGRVVLVQNADQAQTVEAADVNRVAAVTQTTLSLREAGTIVAVLKERFPSLKQPARSDICYATENRQAAVRTLATLADAVIVVGSSNSSNSRSLCSVAAEQGASAYLVDDPDLIQSSWLSAVTLLGLTAGASSPEPLVHTILRRVQSLEPTFSVVEDFGTKEPELTFSLPRELLQYQSRA